MKRLLAALLLAPAPLFAANFATCILDKMPEVQNDTAATLTYRACIEKHPAFFADVAQGSGRGWFSFKDGTDCILKKGAKTASPRAAQIIMMSCRRLYDAPTNAR